MWVLSPERGEEAAVGRRRGTRPPASPDETSSLGQKENAPANVFSLFPFASSRPRSHLYVVRCAVVALCCRRLVALAAACLYGGGAISRGILWRLLEMNMQVHYWGFLLKLAGAARGFRLCISFYTQAPLLLLCLAGEDFVCWFFF